MAKEILDSRRQVMSQVISQYPGGRECAAARLGVPLKRLENQVYENNGHQPLSDSQLHLLEQANNTTWLPEYISRLYGGYFVKLPETDELDNVELHRRCLHTSVKRGLVDQMIAIALEDGEISVEEAQEILALHDKHISARHSQVLATITLHTRDKE